VESSVAVIASVAKQSPPPVNRLEIASSPARAPRNDVRSLSPGERVMVRGLCARMIEAKKLPMEVFKPRFSIAGWMSSVGLIAFFLLVAWISWVSEKNLYFLFVLAMILVSAFLLVALFFLVIYPTMRYEMRRDMLRLVCGPFNWSIPYSEIREITEANLKYHPSSAGWKLPGYAIGKVYYKDRGDVRMCATSMCKSITLIKTDDTLFGVTPKDKRKFVESLQDRMKENMQ